MRLFVALDAPAGVLEGVRRWQRAEGGDERLRPVALEALHVTLAFLGHHRRPAAESVERLLTELEPGPVEGRLLPDPVPVPRRRPRLLALPVESPAAVALQAELSRRLRDLGVYEPDDRPYWPHLTVFRLRRVRGKTGRARVAAFAEGDGQAFGFRRIALYRSDLRPEGAKYALLAANDLPQTGGQRGD
jgi:2'-5' RNA ligase